MPPKKPLYCAETILCPPTIFLLLLKNSLSIQLGERIAIIEQLTELSNHQVYSLISLWVEEQQEFAKLIQSHTEGRQALEHIIKGAEKDWEILNMVYDFPEFDDDPNAHNKLTHYLSTLNLPKLGQQLDALVDDDINEEQKLSILQELEPNHTLDLYADDFLDNIRGIVGKLLFAYQFMDDEDFGDDLLTVHSDIKQ